MYFLIEKQEENVRSNLFELIFVPYSCRIALLLLLSKKFWYF